MCYFNAKNDNKMRLNMTLKTGSKGLHTLWNKRGKKNRGEGRILSAPDDEKFDFSQRFLLLFLKLAMNQ